ncbi:MAG: biotin/lipoate A/B protein ligase family protein, partial [Candidatus Thorarchaeota archaeon]
TVLFALDVERMFTILKVPQEKISDKMIADVKQRVTSVRDILGSDVSFEDLKRALNTGFSEALGVSLHPSELTEAEANRVEELVHQKYNTTDWNFSR